MNEISWRERKRKRSMCRREREREGGGGFKLNEVVFVKWSPLLLPQPSQLFIFDVKEY